MLVVGDNAPAEDGVVSVTVLTRGGRLELGQAQRDEFPIWHLAVH